MLTKQDIETLRAPFPPAEIEFLRGYAYVREQAVNNRLSEVDPAWNMQITAWEYRAENHVVVMGSMTLGECTRCGVGEQLNEPAKDRQSGQLLPPKTLDCAKGAATDLLKRLARLFHVGLYLTELPDKVKDIVTYTAWYNDPTRAQKPPTTPAAASNGAKQEQPKQAAVNDELAPYAWASHAETLDIAVSRARENLSRKLDSLEALEQVAGDQADMFPSLEDFYSAVKKGWQASKG